MIGMREKERGGRVGEMKGGRERGEGRGKEGARNNVILEVEVGGVKLVGKSPRIHAVMCVCMQGSWWHGSGLE